MGMQIEKFPQGSNRSGEARDYCHENAKRQDSGSLLAGSEMKQGWGLSPTHYGFNNEELIYE